MHATLEPLAETRREKAASRWAITDTKGRVTWLERGNLPIRWGHYRWTAIPRDVQKGLVKNL